jgi:DNA polymerase-3 subunit epsilon
MPSRDEGGVARDAAELEALAATLETSADYKVLRRFVQPTTYHEPDGANVLTAAAVDVETTGLDRSNDSIIQLSIVPFTYSPDSGKIFEVRSAITYFEDPGRPIPLDITKLTGIQDADVAGKRIDDDAVLSVTASSSLVIAHNAGFDRPFVERRLPAYRDKPWACSMEDVPWKAERMSSLALEYLLMTRCNRFYGAHRADNDAFALIHLLATPLPDGRLPMSLLLESARRRSVRIWAEGAPIETKDVLKARQYRWNPGTDGRPKAWHKEVPEVDREQELAWLGENIFGGPCRRLRIDTISAKVRYADRA